MPFFGVIGGSGLYDVPGLEITDTAKISTPYGDPSDIYRIGILSGREVAFLPRHGSRHQIPPHLINYRANIWGFRELGVHRIISVGATGGITPEFSPGALALADQIIDMTNSRESTFYDGSEVVHVDFTEPFCPELRRLLMEAATQSGVQVLPRGTYICTNGPRLETAAEIRAYGLLGAGMVGMTAMPETLLARELGICFALLSVITNYAAGITEKKLTSQEVIQGMKESTGRIHDVLRAFFGLPEEPLSCACGSALDDAGM